MSSQEVLARERASPGNSSGCPNYGGRKQSRRVAVEKDVVKEELVELLSEMLMLKDLTAGSFHQPGPSSDQSVTRDIIRSGKSIMVNL